MQVKPSNENSSIRVGSKGDDGDVEQSNSTTAIAAGLNDNETKQSIDQTQGSASKEKAPEAKETAEKDGHMDKGGSSYTQVAGQEADNEQKADADATAVQWKPSNSNDSIRVGSKGDGGDVTQSNDATAVGIAKNDNETKQSIDQTQGSTSKEKAPDSMDAKKDGYTDKGGSSYTQVAGQKADSEQKAFADATAVQVKPSNENSSIRVGSKGDDGDVEQSNSTTAIAAGLNDNETKQSIDQTQGGGSGSGYLQVAGQEAGSEQKADADAFALQVKPSNENAPVRVLSKGDDGDVSQSNSTTAIAAALNDNETKQSIDQIQGGGRGHGTDSVQVAGQGSWSGQKADADAAAIQLGASNENAPVREGSPSGRGGGSVEQSNAVGALALGLNHNTTKQSLEQWQYVPDRAGPPGRRPGVVDGSASRSDDARAAGRDAEEEAIGTTAVGWWSPGRRRPPAPAGLTRRATWRTLRERKGGGDVVPKDVVSAAAVRACGSLRRCGPRPGVSAARRSPQAAPLCRRRTTRRPDSR